MTLSFKAILLGAVPAALAVIVVGTSGSMTGCSNLADVTEIPDAAGDIYNVLPDFDGNYPPQPDAGTGDDDDDDDDDSDAGVPPAYVRLAHLLQGGPAVDLCAINEDADEPAWQKALITTNPNGAAAGGLTYGQVSTKVTLDVGEEGGTFTFALVAPGAECEGAEAAAPYLTFAPVVLAPDTSTTLIAFGSTDAKGALGPKSIAYPDLPASASPAVASVRAFHGVSDIPPVDVIVGTAVVATGVKYGTTVGFPYAATNRTGYGSVTGGAADGTALVLKDGAQSLKFKLPEIKKGASATVFLSGKAAAIDALACIDSDPGAAPVCSKLSPL